MDEFRSDSGSFHTRRQLNMLKYANATEDEQQEHDMGPAYCTCIHPRAAEVNHERETSGACTRVVK